MGIPDSLERAHFAATRPAVTVSRAGGALQVRGVSHAFVGRLVLSDVSFEVPPGVLTGLLGPNGAGKTTLMRVMFGVLDPLSGETLWRGRPVTTADRRRWGYMPQERGLYPAMPAGEQLVFLARLHGVARAEATRSARALLDELGLADRWADRPDKLSGGMQQRLQLAAALVHEPEVIVLDEPFAGLDPVAVEELSATLVRRVHAGRTVLFSSHQLDLVQDLCESIVMLDDGRTVLAGRVADLRASSGRRQLRLTVAGTDRSWLGGLPEVSVVEDRADALRLDVPSGTDPLKVLDAARAAGRVSDFGLDLPTLSQLFMAAATQSAEVT
jgi:ABC-2 type transport system ATP-binding protein